MIILQISTQNRYTDGSRPFLIRDSKNYPLRDWEKLFESIKRNARAGLLDFVILED